MDLRGDGPRGRGLRALAVAVVLLLLPAAAAAAAAGPPRVQRGAMDLSRWDFAQDGPVELAGDWQFLWGQLAGAEGFTPPQGDQDLITLPASWRGKLWQGEKLPGDGRASFLVRLLLQRRALDRAGGLAITVGRVNTAWRLRAGALVLAEEGDVEADDGDDRALNTERVIRLPPCHELVRPCMGDLVQVDLVLQVANRFYIEGGPKRPILIGAAADLDHLVSRHRAWDMLVVGAVAMGVFYYLALWAGRRRDRGQLLFVLFGLAVVARVLARGRYFDDWLPGVTLGPIVKLDHIGTFLGFPAFYYFLRSLFPDELPRLPGRIILGIGSACALVTLTTPLAVYGRLRDPYLVVMAAGVALIVWGLVRAMIHRRRGAAVAMLGFAVLAAAQINELLASLALGSNLDLTQLGTLLLAWCLAAILAERTNRAISGEEALAARLADANRTLGAEVAARTAALAHQSAALNATIESMTDGVMVAQPDGRIEYFNARLVEMMTLPDGLLAPGRQVQDLIDLQVRRGDKLVAGRWEDLQSPIANPKPVQLEFRLFDGRHIAIRGNPMADGGIVSLFSDVSESRQHQEELRELATRDGLTGLFNRRHFLELSEREFYRARRYGRPLAVLMIDADRFKGINDTYGHAVGDQVLRYIAGACEAMLRESDIIGRLGGEEFAVCMPDTGLPAVIEAAERLRACIASLEVTTPKGVLRFTASVGAAPLAAGDADIPAVLARADAALYRAKQEGRNRVVIDGDAAAEG